MHNICFNGGFIKLLAYLKDCLEIVKHVKLVKIDLNFKTKCHLF